MQTLLLAWALGAEGYGVFGFLMGTFGMVSALAGMQLGLTSTVFVSRYRQTSPAKARSVVKKVSQLGTVLAVTVTVMLVPTTPWLTDWLLGPSGSRLAVLVTVLLLPLTVTAGTQEGILQGFEDFKSVALFRLGSSVLSLVLIYPAVTLLGLVGAIATLAVSHVCRLFGLLWRVRLHVKHLGVDEDEQVKVRDIAAQFAIPSVLGVLISNASNWFGAYLLSRQVGGFVELAVVNVGVQWRNPLLMVARLASSVVMPKLSAHHERQEQRQMTRLKNRLILAVGTIGLGSALLIILSSPWILSAYGREFQERSTIMVLVVASAVPQIIANAYLQNILATGRAWRQFFLVVARAAPTALLMWFFVRRWGAMGYGGALVLSWSAFAIEVAVLDWRSGRKRDAS